jgi:hypothetical protein
VRTRLKDWGLNLSILFEALSIAFSIWFGISEKVRNFLLETKKGQINEKIAMLYSYAMSVSVWRNQNVNANYMITRILSDVRSIGRIRRSIKEEQLENLLSGKHALLSELVANNFNGEAERIETTFNSFAL